MVRLVHHGVLRLKFLLALAVSIVFFLGLFSPSSSTGGRGVDGFLRLYHSHNKDFLEIRYLTESGDYDAHAFKRINHFMRSRESGAVIPINPLLITLFDRIQDHFSVDTVEVISGYRSPALNNFLRETGHRVAKESYHLRGWAADIHLDEITEETVSRFVRRLHMGGVGLYPNNLMVHVDVGRMNFWQESPFRNRLDIGEINETIGARLTTDRLFYREGERQRITFSSFDHRRFEPTMMLEWFRRGQWKRWGSVMRPPDVGHEFVVILRPALAAEPPASLENAEGELIIPFGKFRWKVSSRDGRVQYSNEFYLKKK